MSKDANYRRMIQSKEWRALRAEKLSQQPTCERCRATYGRVRAANCVHHVIPCETAKSIEGPNGMRDLLFRMSNLQSLCLECHAEIHRAERSHSKEQVQVRANERHERWKEQHTLKGASRLPRPGADLSRGGQ